MQLKCSKCSNKLTDTKGCVFCEDFKRQFIIIEEDGMGVKAADIGQSILNLLAKDVARLESLYVVSKLYDPSISNEISKAAKTATTLLDSLRKYKEEAADDGVRSFSEEKALFIEWCASLPVMMRREVLRALAVTFGEDLSVAANMQ